ncbi:MAG: hypothetical protein FJW30_05280 [Acidobacteria bacterium]|nr:hypothetical protein [Acidobacteriota bacterium]
MRLISTSALALCLATAAFAQPNGRPVPGSGLIDQPGSYFLTGDRFAVGTRAAILITASDVSLDLNGQMLSGATGLEIRGTNGVTVRNGSISTTGMGVLVMRSNNFRIEGLNIRGTGSEMGIVVVQSRGGIVNANAVYNTFLGVFVRGSQTAGNRISNNVLTAGPAGGALGICYNPAEGDPQGPRGDLISGNTIHGFEMGFQASITSRYNLFRGNSVFFRVKAFELLNDTNKESGNDAISLQ